MAPDRTGSVRGLTRRSFHRIAFSDWGPASAVRPVVCVHGLTRNGRDFDHLAAALAGAERRVICPDLPGRGQSERLHDSSDYVLPQYCNDVTVLMAALDAMEFDWVGTSLGGLIGMVLAALPGSPIRRIVINDIGPYLPWAGLLRLGPAFALVLQPLLGLVFSQQRFTEEVQVHAHALLAAVEIPREHERHRDFHEQYSSAMSARHQRGGAASNGE